MFEAGIPIVGQPNQKYRIVRRLYFLFCMRCFYEIPNKQYNLIVIQKIMWSFFFKIFFETVVDSEVISVTSKPLENE